MADDARMADGKIQAAVAAASQVFQGYARDVRTALARGASEDLMKIADQIEGAAQGLHSISAISGQAFRDASASDEPAEAGR
jgi:hypothetical protein